VVSKKQSGVQIDEMSPDEDGVMMKFDKDARNLSEQNSPSKTKTHLVIADNDLRKIETKVKEQIRRNSSMIVGI